jgi:hypothetical protein
MINIDGNPLCFKESSIIYENPFDYLDFFLLAGIKLTFEIKFGTILKCFLQIRKMSLDDPFPYQF